MFSESHNDRHRCLHYLQSLHRQPPIGAAIGDNAAGISDNAAEIGDITAGVADNAAKVIPC